MRTLALAICIIGISGGASFLGGCGTLDAVSNSLDFSSHKRPVYQGEFVGVVVPVEVTVRGDEVTEAAGIRISSRPDKISKFGSSRLPDRYSAKEDAWITVNSVFEDGDVLLLETSEGQLLDASKIDTPEVTFQGRLRQGYELHQSKLGEARDDEESRRVARDSSIIVLKGLGPLDQLIITD